jgi:hypothetical protein
MFCILTDGRGGGKRGGKNEREIAGGKRAGTRACGVSRAAAVPLWRSLYELIAQGVASRGL